MTDIAIEGRALRLEAMGTAADPSSSRGNRDSSTDARKRNLGGRLRNWRPIRCAPVAIERMLSTSRRFEPADRLFQPGNDDGTEIGRASERPGRLVLDDEAIPMVPFPRASAFA